MSEVSTMITLRVWRINLLSNQERTVSSEQGFDQTHYDYPWFAAEKCAYIKILYQYHKVSLYVVCSVCNKKISIKTKQQRNAYINVIRSSRARARARHNMINCILTSNICQVTNESIIIQWHKEVTFSLMRIVLHVPVHLCNHRSILERLELS